MERFTISLDDNLAREFDDLIAAPGYRSRSTAATQRTPMITIMPMATLLFITCI
jgi:hypothetical protein